MLYRNVPFSFSLSLKPIIACSNITRNFFRVIHHILYNPIIISIRLFSVCSTGSPQHWDLYFSPSFVMLLILHTRPIIQLYILLQRIYSFWKNFFLFYRLFIFQFLSFYPFSSHQICGSKEFSSWDCPSCCFHPFSKWDTFYLHSKLPVLLKLCTVTFFPPFRVMFLHPSTTA